MGEGTYPENHYRLTHEACDLCGKDLVMPEGGLDRPLHICDAMRLDDERVLAWFRSIDKANAKSILGILSKLNDKSNVKRSSTRFISAVQFLGTPKTVADLRQWSKWDLRKLVGVDRIRSNVVAKAMKQAGVPLMDISYQKAAARRRQETDRLGREMLERVANESPPNSWLNYLPNAFGVR